MIASRSWIPCLAVAWLVWPATARAATARPLTYDRDVRPILSDNCFFCHGPDESRRKGKLRLDVRDAAVAKGAIVPGKPDESELVRRVFTEDEDDRMPPLKVHKTLTAAQKETLKKWIAEGAKYERHWAYVSPVRPPAPSGPAAVDYFVRKHLSDAGLKPSPEANRRTLIRRLSFDLTGIPPSPEQVKAFEDDPSPDAYAQLVERLLASPAYGERMAIGWLDVVRYADTIGYHSDNPRNVWPYRDYVIQAFNRDMPFDEFTREQVAGDLLPHSTLQQKVASGFNRLLLSTEEGGAQPKDYEARMLTDRVRAVSGVWLAQTLGCAQCHDHKFDPIKSRDFYSMGAFFADIQEPIIGRREDGMLVPNEQQAPILAHLERQADELQREFESARPELLGSWSDEARASLASEARWTVSAPDEAVSQSGIKLHVGLDGVIEPEKDPRSGTDSFRIKLHPEQLGVVGIRLEVLPGDKLPARGPGRAKDGGFAVTEFRVEDEVGHPVEIANVLTTTDRDEGEAFSMVEGGQTSTGGWVVQGQGGVPQAVYVRFARLLDSVQDSELTVRITQEHGKNELLGRFRLSLTADPDALLVAHRPVPPPGIARLLERPSESLTSAEQVQIAEYHRKVAPELASLRMADAAARQAKEDFEATLPRCLVSVSMPTPRVVRILPRGNWMDESGEVVHPSLPAYLVSPERNEAHLNRLDLANWLVDRENPLTARVFVNRLWKQFFGIGLSKVLDDFGAQGEPPSNPALLDWLACEFMESRWDVKHMVRLLVNSETYRQVSTAPEDLEARDPYNRELARQSRWRLDAELVRDNALSIAGLLTPRIGGPSVEPYQPDGYWDNLNFPVRTYHASKGADQYRRGLYTWWQRSYLHPSLLAFDAPTREECAADRPRSNIPQQALVLLNDPTYVEAARAFAARILKKGGPTTVARLGWAWQQALARDPRPDEVATAEQLLGKQLSQYEESPAAAEALLKIGELPLDHDLRPAEWAAWTNIARVILNLHETITRS